MSWFVLTEKDKLDLVVFEHIEGLIFKWYIEDIKFISVGLILNLLNDLNKSIFCNGPIYNNM